MTCDKFAGVTNCIFLIFLTEKYAGPSDTSKHSDNLQLPPQAPWQCLDRPHSTENTRYHRR